MAQYASPPIQAKRGNVEVSTDGGANWRRLIGSASIAETGGEPSESQLETFDGAYQDTGDPQPGTVEITVPGHAPSLSLSQDMEKAKAASEDIRVRYYWKERLIVTPGPGNTAAIAVQAATGLKLRDVTFAGTARPNFESDKSIGPGKALKIDDKYYVIEQVDGEGEAAGEVKVLAADGTNVVVAAKVYSVVAPPWYRPAYQAAIRTWGGLDARTGEAVGTTLSLAPTALVPAVKVGVIA